MPTALIPLATRVEPELRAAVHQYRREREGEIPGLAEAVRELIRLGLKAARAAQQREQKTTSP
jgi:hypothetical protein